MSTDDSLSKDGAFEFNAPRFHDFQAATAAESDINDDNTDEWFDARIGSPAVEAGQQRSFLSAEKSLIKEELLKASARRLKAARFVNNPDKENLAELPGLFSRLNVVTGVHEIEDEKKNKKSKRTEIRPLTIPKEFNFASRSKMRGAKSPGVKKRKAPAKKSNELTIPKPFKFHGTLNHTNNATGQVPKSPYVPLALRLKKFENSNVDALKPKNTTSILKQSNSLTKPRSPMLLTKFRNKPNSTVIPSDEKEALEVRNHPPFKAKAVNKKILEGAPIGIPSVEKPALTANPIRYTSQPFQPVIEHRRVVPSDFRLPGDEISEKKKKQIDQIIKQKLQDDEEIRRFKANPLPHFQGPTLPNYEPKPSTDPRPFDLETSKRVALIKKTAEEAYTINFVARPMPSQEPFIPKKSSKAPTEPEPVTLHSNVRAEERRLFDESRKQKDLMIEEMKLVAQKQALEAEKIEIRQLRQQQTHQAQPIRQYPAVVVRPSDRKLTEPESPMLKEKRDRLKKKQSHHLMQSFTADDMESPKKSSSGCDGGYEGMAGL
ncbi:hypothetical protein BC829DRAFT_486149 [Chytridium lagenaria]|nr:hypothetical protein BC829DRAFT_486149 [Chytridium lagenaria]